MDVLFLIRRYLRTRRIALVATFVVALAVCAMIVVTSVMDALRMRIRTSIRRIEPDFLVRMTESPPHAHFAAVAEELRGAMASVQGPILALSPRLETLGLLAVDLATGTREELINVIGIDWELERRVIPLDAMVEAVTQDALRYEIKEGEDPFTATAVTTVLVGRSLALGLGLRTGSEFTLGTGTVTRDPDDPKSWVLQKANASCFVAGAFASGRDDFDARFILMDVDELLRLRYGPVTARPDCTVVAGRLTDAARQDLDAWKATLARRHPRLTIETWKDRHQGLLDALDVEKRAMTLVLGLIVSLSVCLILGFLYMMVIEKTRDVGVLRSMGLSGRRVIALFVGYGVALGTVGAAMGCVLGVRAVRHIDAIQRVLGFSVFNRDIPYAFQGTPAILDPSQVAVIALGTVLFSMAAGGIAAWRAAVIDPVRCLRYE